MKKFLSLVLALVMAMSLVTVSAGAKDFNDGDKISDVAYEEAVNVMSEMGIIDGYGDGNFQPQGTLTRGAAAKIIACMMLGKTTAEALGTQAAPFKDVPVGSTFAGYIAYCSESGIIDGYSDGTFRPGNTLTGFAFLKMLLTALGYDSAIEGYANNANWTVNVAGRAKQIGLLNGNDNFVGTRAATREEACLYAVNALQATLVEYNDKGGSISVGDITINTGASNATYITSNVYDQATSIDATRDNANGDWTVEFAEKYQPDLRLDREVDAFGRPSHTWSWKRVEIGSYIDQDKLVTEYTTKVTGRDLYDLLGSYVVDNDTFVITIDGVDDARRNPAIFGANNIIKSNTEGVGATGNGVLTQVFRDTADGITYISIINTYLAEATDDFDEDDDVLEVEVYGYDKDLARKNAELDVDNKDCVTSDMDADNENVPVADYEDGDIILVQIADGEILEVMDPEVISDSTVTAFSVTKNTVTAGGTTYDKADTRLYDLGVLDEIDDYSAAESLKDLTYNIILDPYGYFIGLELNEDPDQYVFITGYEPYTKNLSTAIADAGAIFVDGTMKTIEVKVNSTLTDADPADGEGVAWDADGNPVQNTWYTYTVNSNGVYTLKPVAVADDEIPDADAAQFAWSYTDGIKTIDKSHISLPACGVADAAGYYQGTVNGVGVRQVAYGNAESVYITVETKVLRNTSNLGGGNTAEIISDVASVTTGVKNADIEVYAFEFGDSDLTDTAIVGTRNNASAGVYTLYGDNGYVIAAIVVGEDAAASTSYAYITSTNAVSETYSSETDEHTWLRTAIVNGAEVELKEVGDELTYLGSDDEKGNMQRGEWWKISYNTDGEVIKTQRIGVDGDKVVGAIADVDEDTDLLILNLQGAGNKITMKQWSLYTTQDPIRGFATTDDAKAILIEMINGKPFGEITYYDSKEDNVKDAIDDLNNNFNGFLFAVFEDGVATSVILKDEENQITNIGGGVVLDDYDVTVNGDAALQVYTGDDVARTAESVYISRNGYISYLFGVPAGDAGKEITYNYKVTLNGALATRGTKTATISGNNDVDGSIYLPAYDEGDEVIVTLTNFVVEGDPVAPEVPVVPAGTTVKIVGSTIKVETADEALTEADAVKAIQGYLIQQGYFDIAVSYDGDKYTFSCKKTVGSITMTYNYTFDPDADNLNTISFTVNGTKYTGMPSDYTLKDLEDDGKITWVGFVLDQAGEYKAGGDAFVNGGVYTDKNYRLTAADDTTKVYGAADDVVDPEALTGKWIKLDGEYVKISQVTYGDLAAADSYTIDADVLDDGYYQVKFGNAVDYVKATTALSACTNVNAKLTGDYSIANGEFVQSSATVDDKDIEITDTGYYKVDISATDLDTTIANTVFAVTGVEEDADGNMYAKKDAEVVVTFTTSAPGFSVTAANFGIKSSVAADANAKVNYVSTAAGQPTANTTTVTFTQGITYQSGTAVFTYTVGSTTLDVDFSWSTT